MVGSRDLPRRKLMLKKQFIGPNEIWEKFSERAKHLTEHSSNSLIESAKSD